MCQSDYISKGVQPVFSTHPTPKLITWSYCAKSQLTAITGADNMKNIGLARIHHVIFFFSRESTLLWFFFQPDIVRWCQIIGDWLYPHLSATELTPYRQDPVSWLDDPGKSAESRMSVWRATARGSGVSSTVHSLHQHASQDLWKSCCQIRQGC